ncbi:MAG: error-prone DNA polymerase (plasmid) [Candidatus Manganitrophus sp.]|nr:error-prone DNA polymerase [Candidatus Manganitrophus sp.]
MIPQVVQRSPDYVELHAASAFSFLDGASLPEDLIAQAAHLGLSSLALVDTNGLYGAPRFYKAAREAGIRPLVGAEITLSEISTRPLPTKKARPVSSLPLPRLTLLVASRLGYQNLCMLLTAGALGREKGKCAVTWEQIASHTEGLYCLTGGEEGPVACAFANEHPREAIREILHRLSDLFPGRLYVELQRHRRRDQEARNGVLIALSRAMGLPIIATNGVRYARPQDKELYDLFTSIRSHTPLDAAKGILAVNRERHLKDAKKMHRLFTDLPEALSATLDLAGRLNFTLADLGYRFPDYPLPSGETTISYLRKITWEGARVRFRPLTPAAHAQIEKELGVIEKLNLAGYFLIVWDVVEFCKKEKILVQGRGSAANSAVCYALSITAVDPVKMELLFERFLSEERGEWPDIDLDLPSGDQRERVIQYLYTKYGAQSAAMTANVITYRPKSAIREAAKAFGCSAEQVDRLAGALGNLSTEEIRQNPKILAASVAACGLDPAAPRVLKMLALWIRMQNLPRHLGQHSGGMVIAAGRLDRVVPLEPASMPGRVVIQWDKDDCHDLGILKIDLLGLGMLAALEEAIPMIKRHEGVTVDLAHLPADDPKVFAMIRAADTVGVFQLESRAQMATLPRHAPYCFYDIVVQVGIIRPGPVVGGMVHPFFDRRRGIAPVTYPHPSLEPILKRTLGVPLFQEQVLRMAMVVAGFTGGQAEELRRAMGFKRSFERMEVIEKRLREGMLAKGIDKKVHEGIAKMITAFAAYGFPESHAASFALIAYASAYLRAHHPAAFYASLLNAWPMGFYHPATLVKDAQRRDVAIHPIDVNRSGWGCRWEGTKEKQGVRIGLRYVKGLREIVGRRIEVKQGHTPFRNLQDLSRRCGLREDELDRLAEAGALAGFGLTRRSALWQVAKVARPLGPLFNECSEEDPSPLSEMTPFEETLADYRSAQMTAGPHLIAYARAWLTAKGVKSAAELSRLPDGRRVRAAGAVIVRQRPQTANGFVFLTLEDESGMAQAIIRPDLFRQYRTVILSSPALIVEGILQNADGTLSVRADRIWPLRVAGEIPSHDFH